MKRAALIASIFIMASGLLRAQDVDPSKIEGYYYGSVGHNEMVYNIKEDGSGLLSIIDKRSWKVLGTVPVKFTRVGNDLLIEINSDGETTKFIQSSKLPSIYESDTISITKLHESREAAENEIQKLRDFYIRFNGS